MNLTPGQKNGSLKNNVFNAIGSAYLFTIQKGEHLDSRHLGTRVLTVTVALFTLLLFVYFINEITAEMTAGPSKIPIKTFEDVIHHEYRVIAANPFTVMHLRRAKPGSAKRKVYQMNLADEDWDMKGDIKVYMRKIISEPKTLFYSQRVFLMLQDELRTGQGCNSIHFKKTSNLTKFVMQNL